MTGIRRTIVVIALVVAALLGGGLPAQAAYSDTATVPTTTIGSLQVAPPTDISTGGTKCVTYWDYWQGRYVSTLQAKVSWTKSATTRGVTGYLVTAVFPGGVEYPAAQVGPGTTSVGGDFDISFASQNIQVKVTTLTAYGWTADSELSRTIKC